MPEAPQRLATLGRRIESSSQHRPSDLDPNLCGSLDIYLINISRWIKFQFQQNVNTVPPPGHFGHFAEGWYKRGGSRGKNPSRLPSRAPPFPSRTPPLPSSHPHRRCRHLPPRTAPSAARSAATEPPSNNDEQQWREDEEHDGGGGGEQQRQAKAAQQAAEGGRGARRRWRQGAAYNAARAVLMSPPPPPSTPATSTAARNPTDGAIDQILLSPHLPRTTPAAGHLRRAHPRVSDYAAPIWKKGPVELLLLQVDEARALMAPPSSYPLTWWTGPHGCCTLSSGVGKRSVSRRSRRAEPLVVASLTSFPSVIASRVLESGGAADGGGRLRRRHLVRPARPTPDAHFPGVVAVVHNHRHRAPTLSPSLQGPTFSQSPHPSLPWPVDSPLAGSILVFVFVGLLAYV
ncbi:uncharacterized protein LOC119300247 [Triticum dicoccoides]|uniref:uncharacterized protein LOC119300247 n=1 Tax=Triticum dicoccoides TaxID=85692 RepID=UPI00188F97A9|nr:uncharacterized protein LOC119300247 [Triticum dicoccoides]